MRGSKVRRVSKKKTPGKYKKPLRNLKFEVVSPINEWCYEGMPPWRKSGNVSIKEETYCTGGISGQWPLHQWINDAKEAWLLLCCNYEFWKGQSGTIILIKNCFNRWPGWLPLGMYTVYTRHSGAWFGQNYRHTDMSTIHSSSLVWCLHILPSF